MQIIGIAGGSGAGKSTVSYGLVDAEPDIFEILNLDDFQKLKTEPNLPAIGDRINWDHPDIIRWDKLIETIERLQSGASVTIDVWSHRSNPNYSVTGAMIPRTVLPKPILIIEGYLALYSPSLRNYYDRSYYLEVNETTRAKRRNKNEIIADASYEKEVLIPMHEQYVEPTKNFADLVIDVSSKTPSEVLGLLKTDLEQALSS